MMREPRQRDWWLAPVRITTANNTLGLIVSGSPATVTIPAGTYWPHFDTTTSAWSDYDSLYEALKTAVDVEVTLTLESATPALSSLQDGGGIFLSAASASIDVSATTLDLRLLGWPGDHATDIDISSGAISPLSRRSTWRSWTIDARGVASQKRQVLERKVSSSHDRPTDRWALAYEEFGVREFEYEYVLAGHMFEDDAAEIEGYAHRADLATGDTHNAFETIFRALQQNDVCLVVHDTDDFRLEDGALAGRTEAVTLHRLAESYGDIFRLRSTAGEAYDLRLRTYVIADG